MRLLQKARSAFESPGIGLLLLTDPHSYLLKTCNKNFHLFSSDGEHGFRNTCKRQGTIIVSFFFQNSSFVFSRLPEEATCTVHGIHLSNAYCVITRHLAASLGQERQHKSLGSCMTGLRVESDSTQGSGQHVCPPTHCRHSRDF